MPAVDSYILRMSAAGGSQIRRELEKIEASGRKTHTSLSTSGNKTRAVFTGLLRTASMLAPALGGAFVISSAYEATIAYEKVELRLRTLTQSTEDYAKVQQYLSKTAKGYSADILTLSDNYAKLLSLQESGIINRSQVNAITEGILDASAALGVGQSQIDNVLYGLAQALGQGTVQAQELNQVIEPMPGLLNSLAEAANTTAGGFRQMVKKGEVTSEIFGKYLITALNKYEGSAAKLDNTVTGKLTQLRNEWMELSRTIGDGILSDALIMTIGTLADVVDAFDKAIIGAESFDEAQSAIGKTLQFVARTVQFYWNTIAATILTSVDFILTGVDKAFIGMNKLWAKTGAISEKEARFSGLESTIYAVRQNKKQALANVENAVNFNKPMRSAPPQIKSDQQGTASASASPIAGITPSGNIKELERQRKAIEGVNTALKNRIAQLGMSNKEQELDNSLRKAGVDISSVEGQAIKSKIDELYRLLDVQEKERAKIEEIGREADKMADAFGTAMTGMIRDGESFKDVLGDLVGDISNIFYEQMVLDPVKEGIGGWLKNSSGFGSIISGTLGDLFSFANGGVMSGAGAMSLKTYSNGGVANTPQLALFGEGRMPEAYVPLPDGRNIPVKIEGASSNAGTSQTIINIDARGAEDGVEGKIRSVMMEVIKLRQDTPKIALNAFSQAQKRNSSLIK